MLYRLHQTLERGKEETVKCEICNKKAIYRLSPDMDIKGLGACMKHKEDVYIGYTILMSGGQKEYEEYLKALLNNNK